jgi:hypothetical protein
LIDVTPWVKQDLAQDQEEWLLMGNGAARGNPGDAACGAAIRDETDALVKGQPLGRKSIRG